MTTRLIVFIIILLGMPHLAGAVTFVSEPHTSPVGVGQLAIFTIYIDTEGDIINAFDGSISFDRKKMTFLNVADGDSIISVWLQKLTDESGKLTFSGIIPRGFKGTGKLFTLYFRTLSTGDHSIALSGSAHQNDGKGTRAEVKPLASSVTVVEGLVAGALSEVQTGDLEGPRSIKAIITQNDAMFGGRPFIIVDAKDSTSGILRYELFESDQPHDLASLTSDNTIQWKAIGNPEALGDPLPQYLYVRAIDRAGNATVAEVIREGQLSPVRGAPFGGITIFIGILLLGLVILFSVYRLLKSTHG